MLRTRSALCTKLKYRGLYEKLQQIVWDSHLPCGYTTACPNSVNLAGMSVPSYRTLDYRY